MDRERQEKEVYEYVVTSYNSQFKLPLTIGEKDVVEEIIHIIFDRYDLFDTEDLERK